MKKPTKFPNIHPLLLSLLFAINILVVVVYQSFFVYTIPKPDTEIFVPDGSSGHYRPDFSDVPYFSDKIILDTKGSIHEQIILYQNTDGSVEIVRLKQNILFEDDYALDQHSITSVPGGDTVTLSVLGFLEVEKIVVSNRSQILDINRYSLVTKQNSILTMIGIYAFLLLVLECFFIVIFPKPSKSEEK